MASSESIIASQLLRDLKNNISPSIKENAKIMAEFKIELSRKIKTKKADQGSVLKGAKLKHTGSISEGLSVTEDVDFDLSVVLGEPFVSSNFTIQRHGDFFCLQWKPNVCNPQFSDPEGYLNAAKLKQLVFDEMLECINSVEVNNVRINCQRSVVALRLHFSLSDSNQFYSDLVPQIAFYSWYGCPDLRPFTELPRTLTTVIGTEEIYDFPMMSFVLAVPYRDNDSRTGNISFTHIEKKFMQRNNSKIRDMVRLVKFVAHHRHWRELYSFQSIFPKRIAMKHFAVLDEMELWEGFQTLLKHFQEEISSGNVDGYFIRNQKTFLGNQNQANDMASDIGKALKISASEITNLNKN